MSPNRVRGGVWAILALALAGGLTSTVLAFDVGGDTHAIRSAQAEAEEASDFARRNGAVSSCSTEYAATYDGWIARGAKGGSTEERFQAFVNAEEMDRRRLGVANLSRVHPDQPFVCPPIPVRLYIPALDPTDPRPP